jgi:hypothetical protein
VSVFGGGLTAAVTLRERILRALGAEDAWIEHGESDFVAWMSGPAATCSFVVPERPAHDSAVLAGHLRAAFADLRGQMADEDTAQWGSWKDTPILTCEMPPSWVIRHVIRQLQSAAEGR